MAAPRGKKKRQPKPARPTITPSSGGLMTPEVAVERFGGSTGVPLRGNQDVLQGLILTAEGDRLVDVLIPFMWAGVSEGIPANVCVDACLTLQHAYAQFGIASQVRVVDLVVEQPNGRRRQFGSPTPSWSGEEGSVFNGHTILVLPDSERYVDATVEQFEPVRRLGMGPLVGKAVGGTIPTGSGESFYAPGTMMAAKRGNTLLIYTIAASEYSEQIAAHRWPQHIVEGRHRAGVNLAALALMTLRLPGVIERARTAPYPRLLALLDAAGDAEVLNIDGNMNFMLPGPDGELVPTMLDQIEVGIAVPGTEAVS